MKKFALTFVMAVLLSATAAVAQQTSPESNPDRRSGESSAQRNPSPERSPVRPVRHKNRPIRKVDRQSHRCRDA